MEISEFVAYGLIVRSSDFNSIDEFRQYFKSKGYNKNEKSLRGFYTKKVNEFLANNEIYR